ncbi:MAG: hypothetical protein P1U84_12180 [Parvibaculaceae bacterium]|nr:hypothetical protein [Parvibaculaceae bacterium]
MVKKQAAPVTETKETARAVEERAEPVMVRLVLLDHLAGLGAHGAVIELNETEAAALFDVGAARPANERDVALAKR